MSTQYGIVIYGIPLSRIKEFFDRLKHDEDNEFNLTPDEKEELLEEWEEGDPPFGVKKLYSASGEDNEFGYLGIQLRKKEINTWTSILVSELTELTKIPPSNIQTKEVEAKLNALPRVIKEFVGPPDAWIVWGST